MIILVIVAVVIFYAYQDVTMELVIERNQDLTRLAAGQLEAALNEYVELLEVEARTPDIRSDEEDVQRDALKGASNRLAVFDAGTMILDTYGTVVAAEPERPQIIGQDWSDRAYYRQVLRLQIEGSSEPAFSNIVSDGQGSSDVLCVVVPISSEDAEFYGCIIGMFYVGPTSLNVLYGDMVKLHIEESGDAYLVDGAGQVIYHSNIDHIGEDFSGYEVVEYVLQGETAAVRTEDIDGHRVIAGYSPIPSTSWGLVTEESWGRVMGPSSGYRGLLLGLLALGVIVPTIIVYFGLRRITRPIAEVTDAAREIASGHFSHRIAVSTGDELEDLADQFNIMAGTLQESYSNLEHKVKERTALERRRADQLRAVNEVGRRISSILDLDELLPYVARSLQETFRYHNVGIILVEPESGALILKASAGFFEGGPDIGSTAVDVEGIASWVAWHGEPLLINDVCQHPKYSQIEGTGATQSELAVPIKIGEDTVGVLDLEEARINAFDELDVFTAQTLSDQLAVAIKNARLYEQAQELATVEERQRLARELHDAVTQTLFSASLIAEVIPRLMEKKPEEGQRRLEELRQLTRGALAEMRMLLLELRPAALTEVGLEDLLRHLTDAITGRSTGLIATLTVEGEGKLPSDVQTTMYRIAQESLNNVSKHSEATEVVVILLIQPESVELNIRDNGSGFDPNDVSAGHLGLGIMHERAKDVGAALEVKSKVGQGTEVRVRWGV
ncbi:MAG: cache domain-containing protein [Chloroflexota bacterium]|nr:cache domain-containing protein [Chloroflexota bacterium]